MLFVCYECGEDVKVWHTARPSSKFVFYRFLMLAAEWHKQGLRNGNQWFYKLFVSDIRIKSVEIEKENLNSTNKYSSRPCKHLSGNFVRWLRKLVKWIGKMKMCWESLSQAISLI